MQILLLIKENDQYGDVYNHCAVIKIHILCFVLRCSPYEKIPAGPVTFAK
jgi:hypothetical protein